MFSSAGCCNIWQVLLLIFKLKTLWLRKQGTLTQNSRSSVPLSWKSFSSHGNDTDDTSPTYKVLEEGASTLSKEETTRLASRQLKFIQNLQAALVRIENKTYGVCRETGKLIPKERLRAVPHATLSIEAKQQGKK